MGGVCGRSLTAGKILFTGRQTCSLYLVLWLCGSDASIFVDFRYGWYILYASFIKISAQERYTDIFFSCGEGHELLPVYGPNPYNQFKVLAKPNIVVVADLVEWQLAVVTPTLKSACNAWDGYVLALKHGVLYYRPLHREFFFFFFFFFWGTLFSRKLYLKNFNIKNFNIKNKDNKISQGRGKSRDNWGLIL